MTEPRLKRYARALRERSAEENAASLGRKLTRMGRHAAGEVRVATGGRYPSSRRLAGALRRGVSVEDIGGRVRAGEGPTFFVHPSDRSGLVAAVARIQPDAVELAVAEAERVVRHEFSLLGSGPVALGPSIDWHRDMITGYRWPETVYHRRVDGRYLVADSDIKVPWELSRCQFLPTLGRAYWYTRDERYPAEFVRLVDHWLGHNRPEAGVNWSCAMDVAIRAVNWLWAYHLMADSVAMTAEFEARLWSGLLEHGRFLTRNLEGAPGDVNHNHYLSDIAGLLFLGLLLPEFQESDRWRAIGEQALVREMDDQVLEDGADRELSTSYHRLVTEIFLTCAVLYGRNGGELPDRFSERLSSMIDYTFHYSRPDGTVPILGDADDGRLQRLTTWRDPQREFHDHRHLLAAGAVLFDRADWAAAAGGCWEEAVWLLGESAERRARSLLAGPAPAGAGSRGFDQAGVYVMRSGGSYSIARIGSDRAGGPTSHLHNDVLSFEVFADGVPFLVDPGSYVYTSDPEARNAFRSSLAHNGVVVDCREANRFDPDMLFEMPRESTPTVERWITDDAKDLLVASHSGYRTLPDPVVVRRSWLFDKARSLWMVWDRLEAAGAHSYLVPVQFSPGAVVSLKDGFAAVRVTAAGGRRLDVHVLVDPGLDVGVGDGWVSMCYGMRSKAPRVEFRFAGSGTVDFVWALVPGAPQATGGRVGSAPEGGQEHLRSAVRLFRDLEPAFPFGGD